MGAAHFPMKQLKAVTVEISLHVPSYRLRCVMQIPGVGPLITAI